MLWGLAHRCSENARDLADRHYNRQSIGAPNFAPPGRTLVLYASPPTGRAFWITSWPFAEYTHHAWAGAWVCSAFRNEGAGLSSELIRDAVSATRSYFGDPPELGMITFVDRKKVKPTRVRGVDTWGYCYKKAGFKEVGETKVNKLLAFQLLPQEMPDAAHFAGEQVSLF